MKTHKDIQGDGGSRVVEQIEHQQRQIARMLSGVKNIVAIGSGKGGVGKSTLVMQIANSLAEKGRAVSILDADINGPSQIRLGALEDSILVPGPNGLCVPKTKQGIGVLSFASLFSEATAVDFESVATRDMHTWRATKEFSVLADMLAKTDWGELDFLLVDLPPGAERTVQFAEFLGSGTHIILVTNPSDMSRGIVKRSVAALKERQAKILGLVQNMDGYYCQDCDAIKPLFPSTESVELEVSTLGSVPFDPKLAELCDQGRPITNLAESACAKAISNIADRIISLINVDKGASHEIPVC